MLWDQFQALYSREGVLQFLLKILFIIRELDMLKLEDIFLVYFKSL